MKKKLIWICILLLPVIGFFGYRFTHRDLLDAVVYRPLLLTDEQIDYMRTHPNEALVRLTGKELYMKNVNLVMRIKNEGEIYTGGPLYLRIEGTNKWHEIEVDEIAPKGSKTGESSRDYIIPIGAQNFSQSDQPVNIEVNIYKMWRANHHGAGEKYKENDHEPRFLSNIKYEYYLLSDEQVGCLKSHPDRQPLSLPARDLYMKNINIAVRITNENGATARSLPFYCRVEGTKNWYKIDVAETASEDAKNSASFFIVPVGIQNFSQGDKPLLIETDFRSINKLLNSDSPN
jgi:hypothetical protein